jgi:WD40 repeat protein
MQVSTSGLRRRNANPVGVILGDRGRPYVKNLVFNPRREELASTWADGTLILWDARTGQRLGDPIDARAESVAFSPDGKIFATVGFKPPESLRFTQAGVSSTGALIYQEQIVEPPTPWEQFPNALGYGAETATSLLVALTGPSLPSGKRPRRFCAGSGHCSLASESSRFAVESSARDRQLLGHRADLAVGGCRWGGLKLYVAVGADCATASRLRQRGQGRVASGA